MFCYIHEYEFRVCLAQKVKHHIKQGRKNAVHNSLLQKLLQNRLIMITLQLFEELYKPLSNMQTRLF